MEQVYSREYLMKLNKPKISIVLNYSLVEDYSIGQVQQVCPSLQRKVSKIPRIVNSQ